LYSAIVKARALLVCLAALAALGACDKTQTVIRVVSLHDTASCPITGGSGEYVATGDYDPPAQNHSSLLATDLANQPIDGVPADVQSLALLANAGAAEASWLGVTLVPAEGDVDMLLLPAASACSLNTKLDFFAKDMVLGAVSARTLVAVGASGGNPSYRIDLDTGRVLKMQFGIGSPRVEAAFAALGDGRAIVSGGVSGSVPLPTAEIFDEATGDFEQTTIPLREGRADHGSVTLASGDVLLVGGQNGPVLVANTERITFDASTSSFRTNEGTSPPLDVPRVHPIVTRLADGNVLVGGGFDATGAAVPRVEFFTPDGAQHVPGTVNVPARTKDAFVALDGGGALFVSAPDPTDDPNNFSRAWFVSESAALQIKPDITAPLTDPKLFPRAGGGALLWTGTTWLAYDPWSGFAAIAGAPTAGPDADSPVAAPDPGLRAWVGDDGAVSLWRDSVRNGFATEGPYLTAATATALLAPDAYPPPPFDASQGGLTLEAGRSAFVADARYLDVAIDVEAPGGTVPRVVLRAAGSEIEVGGASCPYPPGDAAVATRVHVERRGAIVSYSLGGPLSFCAAITADARVSVGVRSAGGSSHASNFSVERLTPASQ
jgi:hypothetical protein